MSYALIRRQETKQMADENQVQGWAIAAIITASISGLIAWAFKHFRSIGEKVSRTELVEILKERDLANKERLATIETSYKEKMAALEFRMVKWDEAAQGFARQSSIIELNNKIDNMDTKMERKLDVFQQQMISLLSKN